MRNPARIYPLLNKIGDIWIKNPDLRLGQLIYIIGAGKFGDGGRLFGIEDDEFEELIDNRKIIETKNIAVSKKPLKKKKNIKWSYAGDSRSWPAGSFEKS